MHVNAKFSVGFAIVAEPGYSTWKNTLKASTLCIKFYFLSHMTGT